MRAAPSDPLPGPVVQLITWPSLALGVAATTRPNRLAELAGVEPTTAGRIIRLAGWRELIILAGFLARPTRRSLWWFVGQDAVDLTAALLIMTGRPALLCSSRRLRLAILGYALLAIGDLTAVSLWGSWPRADQLDAHRTRGGRRGSPSDHPRPLP